jgi:uncharacterized phage protein (TIGR02218 family)
VIQHLGQHAVGATEVFRVIRRDGFELLLTTHDRALEFEGRTYEPATLAAVSADRREAALRIGSQDVYGFVDGTKVLVSDMLTHAYRGAEVRMARLDFRMPWLTYERHRRWIRTLVRSGSQWTATLEARTAQLYEPQATRFGGNWQGPCPYELGGPFCKKDIAPWVFLAQVVTVVEPRSTVRFATDHIPANNPVTAQPFADNFYRDGSVEWLFDNAAGAPWTGLTTTTLTDSTQSWTVDEHAGKTVVIIRFAPAIVHAYRTILSNTVDTLTFASIGTTTSPVGTYTIVEASPLAGSVSPVVRHEHSTREFEFLLPTQRDIGIGQWALISPGCDGLRPTCRDKYDNLDNMGGDPFAPSGQDILVPPDEPAQ